MANYGNLINDRRRSFTAIISNSPSLLLIPLLSLFWWANYVCTSVTVGNNIFLCRGSFARKQFDTSGRDKSRHNAEKSSLAEVWGPNVALETASLNFLTLSNTKYMCAYLYGCSVRHSPKLTGNRRRFCISIALDRGRARRPDPALEKLVLLPASRPPLGKTESVFHRRGTRTSDDNRYRSVR